MADSDVHQILVSAYEGLVYTARTLTTGIDDSDPTLVVAAEQNLGRIAEVIRYLIDGTMPPNIGVEEVEAQFDARIKTLILRDVIGNCDEACDDDL